MFRISEFNVSDITFRISFRISERLFGYVMTLCLASLRCYWYICTFCVHALLKMESPEKVLSRCIFLFVVQLPRLDVKHNFSMFSLHLPETARKMRQPEHLHNRKSDDIKCHKVKHSYLQKDLHSVQYHAVYSHLYYIACWIMSRNM